MYPWYVPLRGHADHTLNTVQDGPGCRILCVLSGTCLFTADDQESAIPQRTLHTQACTNSSKMPSLTHLGTLAHCLCQGGRIPCTFFLSRQLRLTNPYQYQEHQTEYGTHWNFFITLGLMPILQVFFHPLIAVLPISLLGVVVALCKSTPRIQGNLPPYTEIYYRVSSTTLPLVWRPCFVCA